jgi:hypothetical protein
MTWGGLTATGLKGPAAQATQAAFDQHQAVANQQNRQPEIDYTAPTPVAHGDGHTVAHFDGGTFAPGACKCQWRRDGRIGLAKRQDGSVLEGTECPQCHKGLYT